MLRTKGEGHASVRGFLLFKTEGSHISPPVQEVRAEWDRKDECSEKEWSEYVWLKLIFRASNFWCDIQQQLKKHTHHIHLDENHVFLLSQVVVLGEAGWGRRAQLKGLQWLHGRVKDPHPAHLAQAGLMGRGRWPRAQQGDGLISLSLHSPFFSSL